MEFETTIVDVKDLLGQNIYVGSIISYASEKYRRPCMRIAKVLKIKDEPIPNSSHRDIVLTIVYENGYRLGNEAQISDMKRVIKLDVLKVPMLILDVFRGIN